MQGAPAGRVKGSSQGSSLEPQDPGEEGFPRPETLHAGRPRVPDFFIFFIFIFLRFFGLFEKNQKNQIFLLIFLFFSFFAFKNQIKSKFFY